MTTAKEVCLSSLDEPSVTMEALATFLGFLDEVLLDEVFFDFDFDAEERRFDEDGMVALR